MSSSFFENIEDEEVDELIAKAKEESLRYYNEIELPRQQRENEEDKPEEYILSSQVGGKAGSVLYEGVEAEGFHLSAGSTYIYPTNYPVRHYQASIVKTALFKNTLVSLPTGLGKTFIAAVVMYNFYRWYPNGKVVFMAPTRPLVAQQTKACHHIMNIPQDHTTEMTGAQSAEQRSVLWKEKRVFYLTPQVMVNDLKMKACPASLIKCVVIDEAHKATKDYAYCQVLKILSETDAVFRVLGLSATPGNDISAVQQVVHNLHISALEMRSEESLDVVPYVHSRSIDTVVVDLSENIQRVKDDLLQIYEKYAKKLKDFKALSSNISSISRFQVLKACEKFRANPPRGLPPAMIGNLYSDFSVCMSLAHALELLQIYGLRAFYTYLSDESGDKNKAVATRLRNDEHLREMLSRLQSCLYAKPNDNNRYTWGHPKLQKLVSSLSSHFQKAVQNKESTKAIIFCQYRVVVTEIVELLVKFKPLIKATEFIGQSGGKEKGMNQVKQLQIMKDFRNGVINCLVATCVAEEGLDIGEVDLIILMEAHKSPVRLVQRIGRTGRKRKGQCIVLLTKGREEQKFRDAMATRKSYVQNIVNAPAVKSSLCQESPRMIPPQCNPVQQLVHIHASNFESPARPAVKKQADIRKCIAAQAPQCSNEEDLLKAKEELGSLQLTFNSIPVHRELWHRQHDEQMCIEELLLKDLNGFSEWNEWNHEEHPTYYISHTNQSKLLCHTLKVATKETLLPDYHCNSGPNLYGNKIEDKKTSLPKEKKKTKKDLKNNKIMDIRNCMAGVTEKAKSPENQIIEILSDTSNGAFSSVHTEPEPKKLKMSNSNEPEFSVPNKVIISTYEENNNMCEVLNKYMVPNNNFKASFAFKLPDLETLLNNVSFEVLFSLNYKKISVAESKSPVSIIGSPLSNTFFEIDDLFDENSCSDKNDISNLDSNIYHYSQKNVITYNFSKKALMESASTNYFKYSPEKSYTVDSKIQNLEKPVRCKDRDSRIPKTSPLLEADLNEKINSSLDTSFPFENVESFVDSKNIKTELMEGVKVVTPDKHSPDYLKNNELKLLSDENKFTEKLSALRTTFSSFKETNNEDFKNYCITNADTIATSSDEKKNYFGSTGKKTPKKDVTSPSFVKSKGTPCFNNLFNAGKKNFVEDEETNKLHIKAETTVSGITCSTPILSVKKFKKNILRIENSAPLIEEKEELTNSQPSEESDMWNLSDLFEDEDKEDAVSAHNTTMLGITQMVSLIEKEKIQHSIPSELVPPAIKTIESVSNKTNNFSDFLDSDVDIFAEINEDFLNESVKKSNCDSVMLSQNYNRFCSQNEIASVKCLQPDTGNGNLKLDATDDCSYFKDSRLDCQMNHTLILENPEETRKSQPVYQSQSVNFKKFNSKKILFSQKFESEPTRKEEAKPDINLCNTITLKTAPGCEKTCTDEDSESKAISTNTEYPGYKTSIVDRISDILSDDSDDVFLLPSHKNTQNKDKEMKYNKEPQEQSLPIRKTKSASEKRATKKEKKPKVHNDLIEVEADVSGIASSDDSDGSSLDNLDNSFINDDSEVIADFTQTMYLKSVKSPLGQGKFKIPNNINYNDNVFSQQIPEDSEYINDSFCVDSDEEMDNGNERSLSFLEIAEQKLENKTKTKKDRERIKLNKRRRIQSISDSSEDEKSLQKIEASSQPSPKAVIKRKKRRIHSDSETEISPQKEVSRSFKKQEQIDCGGSSKSIIRDNMLNEKQLDLAIEEMKKFVDYKFKKDLSPTEEHKFKYQNQSHSKYKDKFSHSPLKKQTWHSHKNKLDKSLHKISEKFAQNLNKITSKYFGLDSSEE